MGPALSYQNLQRSARLRVTELLRHVVKPAEEYDRVELTAWHISL